MLDQRVAVIADIHGNAAAFKAGVQCAIAAGFDRLVVLGDLLTYGCNVDETLDIARHVADAHDATFVLGNHDQLYFDMDSGKSAYYDSMPDWMRESVAWTLARLKPAELRTAFGWEQRYELGSILFAHANPFAYGDWTYLNDQGSFDRALQRLRDEGRGLGVFGHTHRLRAFTSEQANEATAVVNATCLQLVNHSATVAAVTVASVGQPRDTARTSAVTILAPVENGLELSTVPVQYDVSAALRAIDGSSLSEATKQRLRSYLV